MSMHERGPLHGVRVIDLSTVLSGPLATVLLADQGADVIKIEAPGAGDLTRMVGSRNNDMTAMFCLANRGKRSLVLDLSGESGRAVLRRLAESADVIVQNFRPGVAERMGIGYDELRVVNPATRLRIDRRVRLRRSARQSAGLRQSHTSRLRHGSRAGRRGKNRAPCRISCATRSLRSLRRRRRPPRCWHGRTVHRANTSASRCSTPRCRSCGPTREPRPRC